MPSMNNNAFMLISRRKLVACLNSKRIGTLGASMLASGLILQAACSEMNRHAYKDLLNSDGSSTMIVSTSLVALGMVLTIYGCAAEIIINYKGNCTHRYSRANEDNQRIKFIGTHKCDIFFSNGSSCSMRPAAIDVSYSYADQTYTLLIKAVHEDEWKTVYDYECDQEPSRDILNNKAVMESFIQRCYKPSADTIRGPLLV